MEYFISAYPFIELTCALIIIILAVFVISRNPEDRPSRAYSSFLFPMGIASLFEFVVRIAMTDQMADPFNRLKLVLWTISFGSFIYFCLTLAEKDKALKNPLTYLFIYLPVPFLSYYYLFSKSAVAGYIIESFGRVADPASPYQNLVHAHMGLFMAFGLVIVVVYSIKSSNIVLKLRGLLFTIATLIPFTAIPLSVIILPRMFSINTPPLMVPSICAATLLTFYAVKRYSLFAITPAQAADAIMDTSSSSILAIDSTSKISFANQSACKLLGVKAAGVQDQACSAFFDEKVCQLISNRLISQGQPIKNHETSITLPSGERLTIILNGVILKDRFGTNIGAVIDLNDITHKKEAEGEIKKKYEELEKMNKFLIGRELDMAELKKEINNLLVEQNKKPKYTV